MSKGQVQYEIGVELFTRVEKLEAGLKKAQSTVNAEMEKLAKIAAKKAADVAERAARAAQEKVKREMEEFERLYEQAMKRRKEEAAQIEKQRVQEGVTAEVNDRTMPGRDTHTQRGQQAGKRFGSGFNTGLGRVVRGVMAASVADSILEGIIKGIKDKEMSIAHAIGNELSRILSALGELGAMLFDKAGYMGGAMGMESAQQNSRAEAQANQQRSISAARRKEKQERGLYERNQMISGTNAELKRREIGRSMSDYDDLFGEAGEDVGKMQMDSPEKIKAAAAQLSAAATRALKENLVLVEELEALEESRINSNKDLGELEKQLKIMLITDEMRQRKNGLRDLHEDRMKFAEEFVVKENEALEKRLEKEKEEAIRIEEEKAAIARANRDKMRVGREGLEGMMGAAQDRAAGMTSTFSTAGGSFTTAVNAQVDHLKVMREAIQRFPQLLMDISSNTAAMVVNLG